MCFSSRKIMLSHIVMVYVVMVYEGMAYAGMANTVMAFAGMPKCVSTVEEVRFSS